MAAPPLRVGCVRYLNARPLIDGWPGHVVFDHPAVLSQQLAEGELDLALVSSFEFLRNPIYQIVDHVAIGAAGAVYSVFVACQGDPGALRSIAVDPASLTSVNLLRILLARKGLASVELVPPPGDGSTLPSPGRGRLLIGDQALAFREEKPKRVSFWDLGEEWTSQTGLPFIFALWLIRPEVSNAAEVAEELRELRDRNAGRLGEIALGQTILSAGLCEKYLAHHLRYSFGPREKEGLRAFEEASVALGLLAKETRRLRLV